jgi:hypothetical protein
MKKTQVFKNNLLQIEFVENDISVSTKWNGKSVDRKPGIFITPILMKVLNKGNEQKKEIVLDFREIEYMNSSTITPVIKILERAKRGKSKITVLYKKSLKWQELIFSALEIFQTKDERVQIIGCLKP